MSIGKLETFNVSDDNWILYVKRVEQFYLVNNVAEDNKVATLITVMGKECYELLHYEHSSV